MGRLLKKFKSGSVTATIWENEGQPGPEGQPKTYMTVNIARSYKDKQDQWKDTNSFRIMDLYDVEIVGRSAYEFLRLTMPEVRQNTQPPQPTAAPVQQHTGQPQQQFAPQ